MSQKSIVWTCAVCGVLVLSVLLAVAAAYSDYSYYSQPTGHDGTSKESSARTLGLRARLREFILPLLEPEDTVYAPGFNEDAFSRVGVGATAQEVLGSLGEPLRKKSFPEVIMRQSCSTGCTVWYYSRNGPRSKNFRIRAIEFDDEARVVRKFRQF